MRARVRSWLRSLRHRKRVEREMDEELRFHIDSYVKDLCSRGLPQEEASRRARLEFGAVEARKDECRDSLGLRLWDEAQADLRNAVRMLRQSPLFTTVAVVSLALGIGANTAIFTLANQFLLKTLPLPNSEQLRLFAWAQGPHGRVGPVWGSFDRDENGQGIAATFPYPLYQDIRRSNKVMADVAAFKDIYRVSATYAGEAEPVDAILVSGNFYSTFGARVEAGRAITPADDSPSSSGVVVISDAYWSSRFGRSADAIGKTIRLNSVPLTIIGVNEPDFHGPKAGAAPQVFFPLSLQPSVIPDAAGSLLTNKKLWWVFLMGRLKPGVTDSAAAAAVTIAFQNAFHNILPEKKDVDMPRLVLQPGDRGFDWGQKRMRKPLYLLLAVSGLVLLLACANLANLLLSRAAVRQREISLRLAMGAGRGRILRQVLTESLLLAFLGGMAGCLLAYLGRGFIPHLLEDSWSGHWVETQMDWRVFGFASLLTVATGLLFGIVPAWRCTQEDANGALKETVRMTASRSKARLGKALVVFQVALSLLLVVAAGLFLRTFLNLRSEPTGMNTEHILLFELNPPQSRYSATQRIDLFQRIAQGLATLPGVQNSTSSSEPLLADSMDDDCYRVTAGAGAGKNITSNYVGSNFFSTFGIPILSGRSLGQQDTEHAQRVVVINKALARDFFPNRNPLGQTIFSCDANARAMLIVGISADAKYSELRSESPPTIYIPFTQVEDPNVLSRTFELKTAANPASIVPKLRALVQSVDKDLPVLEVRTQDEQIDALLSTERIFAVLTSGFGFLALILASIGIYGVMAYTVSRRTNEIGIRMALGAQSRTVLAMVLKETSALAFLGIAAGILSSLAATRIAASMLFGVKATDPITFLSAAMLLLIIALIAALLPAWRASRVEPTQALRHS